MKRVNFQNVSSKATPINASNLNQMQGDVKMGTGLRYEDKKAAENKAELKKIGGILGKFIFNVLWDSVLLWLSINFVFIVFKWGIRANFLQILAPYLLYVIMCYTCGMGGKH